MLFWTRPDLESKLRDFQDYYYNRIGRIQHFQDVGRPGRHRATQS
jgi:hypothetical protein